MRIDVARPAPGHAVVVVAVLVIAVLSAGVVVATARTSADRAAGDARATGLGAATALDDLQPLAGPTSTATSVPAPTTTRPTTAVAKATPAPPTTKKAPTPAGSVQQPPGGYGQKDPSSVTVPYQPGQSSWSGTSNGIALKVTMQPAVPKAGEPVRFVLEAVAPTATCCQLHIWFGDGFGWPAGVPIVPCDAHALRKGAEVTHTCAPAGHRQRHQLRDGGRHGDRRDGFIQRLVLDWGDGTPAQIPGGPR